MHFKKLFCLCFFSTSLFATSRGALLDCIPPEGLSGDAFLKGRMASKTSVLPLKRPWWMPDLSHIHSYVEDLRLSCEQAQKYAVQSYPLPLASVNEELCDKPSVSPNGGNNERPGWFMPAVAASRVLGYSAEHWLIINMQRVGFSGNSLFTEIKKSWERGGVKALNEGVGVGLARSAFWPVRLKIYDIIGSKTQEYGPVYKTAATALSMAFFEMICLKPFEVMLAWKASPNKHPSSSLIDIMRPQILYKRSAYYFLNTSTSWGLYFGCDMIYRTIFQKYFDREQLSVPQLLGVGACTTFTSGALLAPQRLALLLLQTPNFTPQIHTPKEALARAVQMYGMRGVARYVGAASFACLPGNLLTAILLSWLDQPPPWLMDFFPE